MTSYLEGATDKFIHGYMPAYFKIRDSIEVPRAICEIGVREGDSLRLWQEMYPGVKIVGVDYDSDSVWPEGTVQIFSDQADSALPDKLREHARSYDMIVDDASHVSFLTELTWKNLWPLVSKGGFYVIEDWEVGFPNSPHHGMYGTGSVTMAKSFLEYLDSPRRESIESIEYRHGMIIFKKV